MDNQIEILSKYPSVKDTIHLLENILEIYGNHSVQIFREGSGITKPIKGAVKCGNSKTGYYIKLY